MRPGRPLRARRWAGPALVVGAVLLWLALSAPGGVEAAERLAAALAATAGALLAGPARRAARRLRGPPVGEIDPAGHTGADDRLAGAPAPSPEEQVTAALRRFARSLDAVRVTVWERDDEAGLLVPRHCSHAPPPAVPAAGDPINWALTERQPLRLDRSPGWAAGPVTAAPVAERLALTAEGEDATPPPGQVAHAAAIVGTLLGLVERERRAAALGGRFDRFMDFLDALQGAADPGRFAEELARALTEMAEADGAVVAAWNQDRGRVLAAWGTGGGPAPGTYFAIMDGELAMAARAGDTIRRSRTGRAPVLAHAGERWTRPPRHLTVIPLVEAAGAATGVAAFWGEAPPEEAAIGLVEGLGPLLALQLRHSTDLVRFREVAHEDALTGLRNRAALEERLADERHRFHRYRRPVSLLVLDLDHFKAINDTFGHPAGDAVLQRVADIVRGAIRDADIAFRFGGEELVVLLPETMRREAGEVAERIRAAIADAVVEWGGHRLRVTVSIGVSSCSETVEDPDELLRSADQALYESKRGGRNRVTIATPAASGG